VGKGEKEEIIQPEGIGVVTKKNQKGGKRIQGGILLHHANLNRAWYLEEKKENPEKDRSRSGVRTTTKFFPKLVEKAIRDKREFSSTFGAGAKKP